jgi:phosphatidylserine/phosphatidylglycerophosphate/cardiolipin synthase-like enzyme
LVVAAAAGAVVLAAGPTAPPVSAATGEPKMGAVFNNPGTDPAAIARNIAAMVDRTPPGSIVRIALYRINGTDKYLLSALQEALKRGVKVRLVVDKSNRNLHPMADDGLKAFADQVREKVGAISDPDRDSFVVQCSYGCIGTEYNHNKFYLFSTMGSRTKVVVQSTANAAADNTSAWNASYSVAGKAKLYAKYVSYFDDLAHQRTNKNYYRTVTDGIYKAFFFPRASSTRNPADPKTDTIVGILNNVKCTGNKKYGATSKHVTMIRIAMWGFTRTEVAKRLLGLARQGCRVDIAANDNLEDFHPNVRSILKQSPNINVDNTYRNDQGGDTGHWMHAKYLLIEGSYAGKRDSKVVFMGSHNFTLNALRNNDETWLRIQSATVHDQFRQNFRTIMAEAGDMW